MVLTKDTTTQPQEQTVITTRTTVVPGATTTEPIVKNVMEKPVLESVIEKRDVEIHHKPVIQEVHDQKVIEFEKQHVVQQVQEQPVIQKMRATTEFQEVGTGELGEQERLKLQSLRMTAQPTVQQTQSVREVQEGETIGSVVRQEVIERHIQPVVTEVRQQHIVEEVIHPVTRTVHEPTIIREVPYTADTGRFTTFDAKFIPSATTTQQALTQTNAKQANKLRTISLHGKRNMYGLSFAGELYRLVGTERSQSWQHVPTGGQLFRDISVGKRGALFGIGLNDGFLYRIPTTGKPELVVPGDTQRLSQLTALSKRKIYALTEDGSVLYLQLARFGSNHAWVRLGGKLKKISCGGGLLRRTELWGIGEDNKAYRYYDNTWVPYNVQLQDISVAADNSVYGVDLNGHLVKWNGAELFQIQDKEIKGENRNYLANARLTNVAAYKESRHVYAIEQGTGNILKMLF